MCIYTTTVQYMSEVLMIYIWLEGSWCFFWALGLYGIMLGLSPNKLDEIEAEGINLPIYVKCLIAGWRETMITRVMVSLH